MIYLNMIKLKNSSSCSFSQEFNPLQKYPILEHYFMDECADKITPTV